jgi:hypothetical protein
LDEKCQRSPQFTVGSTQLFAAYESWCAAEREDSGTPKAFADAMKAKGFENYRSNGKRWRGLGLTEEAR